MKLTIHRGTHEIGGSCIEITTASTRIFLDFGLPLVDREGRKLKSGKCNSNSYHDLAASGIAPSIPCLQSEKDSLPASLLLTHSHLDHYGLSASMPVDIPVYSSVGTKRLLEIAHFFNQTTFDPSAVLTIKPWKTIQIGDFKIMPYLADHSAVDAFSYLIEADGMRVFYSGDIRAHGRKKILFESLLSKPPADIDYLILEGSILGRETNEIESEHDIENKLSDELSKGGLYLASFSSQNIDRFVSFFNACRSTRRTLVVDPYTASILYALKELSPHIPQFDWDNSFKVFFVPNSYTGKMAEDKSLFKYKNAKITIDEILADPSRMVIKENFMIRKILKSKMMLPGAKLIYSMWSGYLEENDFWKENNVPVEIIHCSGHAYKKDLLKLVEAVNPGYVIPNHTFHPEEFADLFGDKVLMLNDGETIDLNKFNTDKN